MTDWAIQSVIFRLNTALNEVQRENYLFFRLSSLFFGEDFLYHHGIKLLSCRSKNTETAVNIY